MSEPMNYRFTRHALEEMERRGIDHAIAEEVLAHPQQTVPGYQGRIVHQSIVEFPTGKEYLVRVIVDPTADPKSVITLYRTSNIEKYWRQEP